MWWWSRNMRLARGNARPAVLKALFLLAAVLAASTAFCADWSLNPGISVKEEYNDNVLYTRSSYEIDDFITRVTPYVNITGATETTQFTLDAKVIGEDYWDHSELDVINTDNRASLRRIWSDTFETTLSGSFRKDETLEQELEAAGMRAYRETRYRYKGDLSGQYRFSDYFTLSAGGGPNYSIYPDGPYPDLESWDVYINPFWQLDERDIIGLYVNYNYADYEDSSELNTVSGYCYYRRELSETSYYQLGIGYRHTHTRYNKYSQRYLLDLASGLIYRVIEKERESSSDGNLIFNAQLSQRWTDRFSTVASAAREHYNSIDARSVDLTYTRLNLSYRLTETISTNLRLSFDLTEEDGEFGDDVTSVSASPYIKWKITPDFALKAGASYRHSWEDRWYGEDYNIERFTGWISLSYDYLRLLANH